MAERHERKYDPSALMPREVEAGHERVLARSAVNLAIGKLRARRAEGLVEGDAELVREMTEEVRRARGVLEDLDRADLGWVRQTRERYGELVRTTPEVPTEVLDRYEREFGNRDDDIGEEIFPMGPPPEDFM